MCGNRLTGWNWLPGLFVIALLMLPAGIAACQEATSESAAAVESPATTQEAADPAASAAQEAGSPDSASESTPASAGAAAESATTNSATAPAATPATSDQGTSPTDARAAAQNGSTSAAAGAQVTTRPTESTATSGANKEAATPSSATDQISTGISPYIIGIVIVALFILPVLAGNFLAKVWKMPDHAWKFSLVLGSLAASLLIITFGEFKFGPDLAGGITLVYEPAPQQSQGVNDGKSSDTGNDNRRDNQAAPDFSVTDLITALKNRVDPTGTREVTVRPYGDMIEIIIPKQAQEELDFIKRRITDVGQLEFRITADPNYKEDQPIIDQAKLAPLAQKIIVVGGEPKAEWVAYSVEEFGLPDETGGRIVKRMAGDVPEALILIDPLNVTGDYLSSVTEGVDPHGGPAVNFTFDRRGATGFRLLTSQNKPNPSGAKRQLGIVLDKRLISAPQINETISDQGQISGGSMDREEVQYIIGILRSGRLPTRLNKTPISEDVVSPTLGKITIEKGKQAIFWSMVAVIAFMIVYYRFAGIVACLALSFNLLLVLALMVLIKGAFTLPGLAGLVLTIGMAVDANVLIYERIREELAAGAQLRMAIRNGFSRAMSAIIDSNVTTIISGIALYAIGTDQVKGFAVTLILGLLTSMFTAIFFSRIVFDVAERRGWIKNLRMLKLLSQPNYDFLGKRWPAIGASLVLIAVGLVAATNRGQQLFDIDFTGGTSVTFSLKPSDRMPITDVRDALINTELKDKNLLVVERTDEEQASQDAANTRYSIDTSEQSVDTVQELIKQAFGNKLMTYSVNFSDLKPVVEGDVTTTAATVTVNDGPDYSDDDGISFDALRERLRLALAATGHENVHPMLDAPGYQAGSSARYKGWTVQLTGLDADAARQVLEHLQSSMQGTPLFPTATKIGGRVSSDMQSKALLSIVVSLIGVVIYLWLRFQKVSYGLAAAIAVAHDVLVTIGLMAISAYVVSWIPGLASALQIDAFQINLTIVAALLTIIGYSLNDTIVTFDRLREIKGKSPRLTSGMVNAAVNQCLGRTILTALTVFLTVTILYFFGGDGIHSFAFAFLVGVIAGTYSTVYIAAPMLLWLSGEKITDVTTQSPRVIERAG